MWSSLARLASKPFKGLKAAKEVDVDGCFMHQTKQEAYLPFNVGPHAEPWVQ